MTLEYVHIGLSGSSYLAEIRLEMTFLVLLKEKMGALEALGMGVPSQPSSDTVTIAGPPKAPGSASEAQEPPPCPAKFAALKETLGSIRGHVALTVSEPPGIQSFLLCSKAHGSLTEDDRPC